MQKRHQNRERYFDEQVYTTEKYVIPFLQEYFSGKLPERVLEIGCGEAGNLQPFLDKGCKCRGIDLNESKIKAAEKIYATHPQKANLSLIAKNIYDINDFSEKYDLIMMRDVIEHIHNQELFIGFLKNFMHNETGKSVVFFAFPPWMNPFGGHQQVCKNKLLSHLPYFHLLPKKLYKWVLKLGGETPSTIEGLLEIKETGISLERFEKCIKDANLSIYKKQFYFINPNYEVKFGLKPRNVYGWIGKIPIIRNFFITCGYYAVELNERISS